MWQRRVFGLANRSEHFGNLELDFHGNLYLVICFCSHLSGYINVLVSFLSLFLVVLAPVFLVNYVFLACRVGHLLVRHNAHISCVVEN